MNIQSFWPEWSVGELIGKGSFGSVYKISRKKNNYIFYSALKVIHIPVSDAELQEYYGQGMDEGTIRKIFTEQVKLLENEIVLMESLKSAANVVSIEDHYVETAPKGIGWTFYIRMELLESLNQYLQRVKKLSKKEVVKLGIDISSALVCCEEANIIHRDIKPGNIFRSQYGDFKLGDFGIARRLEGKDTASTKIGTPSYEAPEIVYGKSYDHTVDIYALGIVLYSHLNHGRKPFMPPYPEPVLQEAKQEAYSRRLSGEPMPLPDEADPELADIVMKACAFNLQDRYQSAAELRDLLKRYEVLHSDGAGEALHTVLQMSEGNNSRRADERANRGTGSSETGTAGKKIRIIVVVIGAVVLTGIIIAAALSGISAKRNRDEKSEIIVADNPQLAGTAEQTEEPEAMEEPEPTEEPKPTATPETASEDYSSLRQTFNAKLESYDLDSMDRQEVNDGEYVWYYDEAGVPRIIQRIVEDVTITRITSDEPEFGEQILGVGEIFMLVTEDNNEVSYSLKRTDIARDILTVIMQTDRGMAVTYYDIEDHDITDKILGEAGM